LAPTLLERELSNLLAACTEGGSLTPVTKVSAGEWLSWLVLAGALVIFGVLSGHRAIVVLGSVFCAGCVVGLLWSSRSPQPDRAPSR